MLYSGAGCGKFFRHALSGCEALPGRESTGRQVESKNARREGIGFNQSIILGPGGMMPGLIGTLHNVTRPNNEPGAGQGCSSTTQLRAATHVKIYCPALRLRTARNRRVLEASGVSELHTQ
jgi:hypothetical protein